MVEVSSITSNFPRNIYDCYNYRIIWNRNCTWIHILGRAMLLKFPRVQNNAKKISVGLFFLFLIKMQYLAFRDLPPLKRSSYQRFLKATSSGEIASIVFTILGVNTGFLAVLAISVTVISLLLLRSTKISGGKRAFVILVSLFILELQHLVDLPIIHQVILKSFCISYTN